MSAVVGALALAVTAAGLVAGAAVLVSTGRALLALHAALDLWTAAGLLRLSGTPDLAAVVGAAAVLALRQVVGRALRQSAGATGSGRP